MCVKKEEERKKRKRKQTHKIQKKQERL